MDRRTERIGYLVNKEGRWFLNTEKGQNTFTNEFSAKFFATRYNIRLVTPTEYLKLYDEPRNQSV